MFTSYYSNGKVKEAGEYVADKKHKEWKTYDEQGKLERSIIFKAGSAVNEE